MLSHPFPAIYNKNSRILILGSFPSVKSREVNFFYGNPQNRFWKVIVAITGSQCPDSIDAKKVLLLEKRIALWDVIQSCNLIGSQDSSIKDVVVNDLDPILEQAHIEKILLNGTTAYNIYKKVNRHSIPYYKLPSTSGANARYSEQKLIEVWQPFFA